MVQGLPSRLYEIDSASFMSSSYYRFLLESVKESGYVSKCIPTGEFSLDSIKTILIFSPVHQSSPLYVLLFVLCELDLNHQLLKKLEWFQFQFGKQILNNNFKHAHLLYDGHSQEHKLSAATKNHQGGLSCDGIQNPIAVEPYSQLEDKGCFLFYFPVF